MSVEVKAQNDTALASVKAIYDAASEANALVSQADQSVFGTITYEYDNSGTIETVYKRGDGTYYYIDANDEEVTVAEADLERDSEGLITNRQNDGLDATIEAASQAASEASGYAEEALGYANSALTASSIAYGYANNAQLQLSEVENVLGVLNWVAEHGEYQLTSDTTPKSNKVYYTLSGSEYIPVTEVASNPQAAGYYELVIDKAVTNYISSHLSLTETGLYVQMDNSPFKLQVASDGVHLWNATGKIATYSSSVTLGNVADLHVVLSAGRLGFWEGSNEVAWISTDTLHIADAEITNTLRLGNFIWKPRSGRLTLMYSPVS